MFLLSSFLLLPVGILKAEASDHWVVCQKIESTGLFEQCEDVKVIKKAGTRARAYSMPRKRLLNVKLSQIFKIREFQNLEKSAAGEPVLIPASLLWSSSKKGFQTLCELTTDLNADLAKVTCGSETRTVSRKALLKVVESMDQGIQLKIPQANAEKNITQKSSLSH